MRSDLVSWCCASWGLGHFVPLFGGEGWREPLQKQGVVVWDCSCGEVEELLSSPCTTMRWLPCANSQPISLATRRAHPTLPEAGRLGQYILLCFQLDTIQVVLIFWEGRAEVVEGTEVASSVWSSTDDGTDS